MKLNRLLMLSGCIGLLTACGKEAPPPPPPEPVKPAMVYDTSRPGEHRFSAEINRDDFLQHLRTVASDEFQGRGPGTLGERLTTAYFEDQFNRIGLSPAFGDSYLQAVPVLEITPLPESQLSVNVNEAPFALEKGKDVVFASHQNAALNELKDSELVFVGFGVNAPEANWNDYANVDVKGKTVVLLINDPGFETNDANLFKGQAMMYYGRWTYKFEEAARQGAAGCLIIHDTAGAGYDWSVVQSSWSGPEFVLRDDGGAPKLALQGWLHGDKAKALFAQAGLDLPALRQSANQAGFQAQTLNAKLTASVHNGLKNISSNNVAAMIKGASKPDEAVVYSAHWDHLGVDDKHQGEDNIFNGAIDNGTGVAALLEIAEQMKASPTPPARSVIFFFTTLEESGLLGSRYYAAHPPIPLHKTLAVINIDAMPVQGRAKDMTVIGFGQSNLEDVLGEVIQPLDRTIVGERTPEKGFFFRSDHFNFARKGVPALYARSGWDLREGGEAAGKAAVDDYGAHRYHKADDEYSPSWKLEGTMEDVQALAEVGLRVANDLERWPQWKDGSEFKAIREAALK